MKKTTIAIIAAALVILAFVLFQAGQFPARVVVMNQSGHSLRELTITVGQVAEMTDVLRNGEVRRGKLPPGKQVVITFLGADGQRHRWTSTTPLSAFRAMTVTVQPGDTVELAQR